MSFVVSANSDIFTRMPFTDLLRYIDEELARLTGARALIASTGKSQKRRGRPPGSKNGTRSAPIKRERSLSPEARAKIAAAQKRRWAQSKKV
jgi:hypothetical protein